MALDFEGSFREELYKKYDKCPKSVIPREEYCANIAEIKKASQDPKSKSRLEYYLLAECEILWCGDNEKLIEKHWTKEASPIYHVSIEDRLEQQGTGLQFIKAIVLMLMHKLPGWGYHRTAIKDLKRTCQIRDKFERTVAKSEVIIVD